MKIRQLIAAYRSDPDSKYCKSEDDGGLRYRTKENYDSLMRRLESTHLPAPTPDDAPLDFGNTEIKEISARMMLRLHAEWLKSGTDMAHSLVGMLRALMTFGATLLESAECRALKVLLHDMRFKMGKPRKVYLSLEQASAVRARARAAGLHSLALAQAFQSELAFRQKDVIGEWTPISVSRAVSDVMSRGQKWLRGIRWEGIDGNLILCHVTSKKSKDAELDLKLAPMIIEELERAYPGVVVSDAVYNEEKGEIIREMVVDRSKLPTSGPIILEESTGLPYANYKFRRKWRRLANELGIPKNVQNRDSRSGKITQSTNSGASLDEAKELAGHSNIATTQIYARGKVAKAKRAMLASVIARVREAEAKPKMLPYFPQTEGAA
jgi:hypothetical protein